MNAELIECLRCENENYGDCSLHESDCKYRFGIYCAYRQMMRDAADALEELQDDWEYCSDLLNIAIRTTGISMTALVKLYEIECADRERSKHDEQ